MTPEEIKGQLNNIKEYFERSTRLLEEEHSTYAPQDGLFTVVGHIAHSAQTIEWFFDSAFGTEWNMDWAAMDKAVRTVTSLAEARAWFDRAISHAIEVAEAHTAAEWESPFKPNPIMGEIPRHSIVSAVLDHTAHHRGALTVYQRLLGITPLMPYMEM
jgi:uncharacterized damage-inducible protein DinB